MACPLTRTTDGHEMQLGTNHFGHFKLVNLLAGDLLRSAPYRVVHVSSIAHSIPYTGGFQWTVLQCERCYTTMQANSYNKITNIRNNSRMKPTFMKAINNNTAN